MAATATRPWQAEIIDQLGAVDDDPALTHAVVYLPPPEATDEVDLLDRCDNAEAALISAEDWATKVEGGEVRIVTLADLVAWNRDHDHPVRRAHDRTAPAERRNRRARDGHRDG